MNEADLAAVARDALMVTLKLAGPVLTVGLLVGLAVSMFQALTQINESTLVFIPKLLGVCITLGVTGGFMMATLVEFTRRLFDHIITIGQV
jgi:flagellar biosynthetic protein FliQ